MKGEGEGLRVYRVSEISKTITEKRSELLEFAEEYLENHTFINSKSLAIAFNNSSRAEQPPRGQVNRFGQILRTFSDNGLIEKYNNRQYIKIGGV